MPTACVAARLSEHRYKHVSRVSDWEDMRLVRHGTDLPVANMLVSARASQKIACRFLRRDAIGQRVGMKIAVITQTSPRTVLLGRLRDAVLFARRKVVPGIVPGDG